MDTDIELSDGMSNYPYNYLSTIFIYTHTNTLFKSILNY